MEDKELKNCVGENTMSPIELDKIFAVSDDVVARKIEDEFIIVPLAAGVGDMEDELYSLNDVGLAIWERLDGKASLRQIVAMLASEYEVAPEELERDVRGFVGELVGRRMLVEVPAA